MSNPRTLNEFYRLIMERKIAFLAVFFVAVAITYGILFAIDFIPEPIEVTPEVQNSTAVQVKNAPVAMITPVVQASKPVKIIFDTLDKEVVVLNPASRDIPALDEALLSGAVRHPDSADFTEPGNIFILAHSSYLPNVLNKNFQAFNGIQKLTWGDTIRIQSADTEYVYRVDKVYEAKASEVFVPETPGEAKLTLATCNSFGSKDDRYMVEAVLVGQYQLSS